MGVQGVLVVALVFLAAPAFGQGCGQFSTSSYSVSGVGVDQLRLNLAQVYPLVGVENIQINYRYTNASPNVTITAVVSSSAFHIGVTEVNPQENVLGIVIGGASSGAFTSSPFLFGPSNSVLFMSAMISLLAGNNNRLSFGVLLASLLVVGFTVSEAATQCFALIVTVTIPATISSYCDDAGNTPCPPVFSRDITLQAFSRKSWINTPVGTGAIFSDSSYRGHTALRSINITANTIANVHSASNTQPWYVAVPGSNAANITILPPSIADPYQYPNSFTLLAPTGVNITPSVGTGHMTIVDPVRKLVWHGYTCNITHQGKLIPYVVPGCAIQATLAKIDALDGDAITTTLGSPGETRYGWGDCEIRIWEALRHKIEHVLRCVFSVSLVRSVGSQWNVGQPWPTFQTDFPALDKQSPDYYSGDIPFGVLMAIPSSFDIATFRVAGKNLTANQMTIAIAAQGYGIIARDTTGTYGGAAQFSLDMEPDVAILNPAFVTEINEFMPYLVQQLAFVTNMSPNTYPYAGGGLPVVPRLPPAFQGDT